MRHILYIIMVAGLLLGCQKQPELVDKIDERGLSFGVTIEGMTEITTKNVTAVETLNELYVLVFDHNGHFIGRHLATYDGNKYHINILTTDQKRVLHFVGNYNWNRFIDEDHIGENEHSLIMGLKTDLDGPVFWQRLEMPNGIGNDNPGISVSLIRNYAKATLENQTSGNNRIESIQYFYLGASLAGTVAPYDASTSKFDENVVTEAPNVQFLPTPWVNGNTSYLYEHKARNDDSDLFVIIYAIYIDGSTRIPCYYKIALKGADGKRIDIRRNFHYLIRIKSVTTVGYNSSNEAEINPPANNVDIVVENYENTHVSDGRAMLYVEKTEIIITQASQLKEVRFEYIPNINTGATNNSAVTISAINIDPASSIDINSIVQSNGVLSFRSWNELPTGDRVYNAEITLSAGSLTRKITVKLQQPAKFTTADYGSIIAPVKANEEVKLNFEIPQVEGVKYPLPIYITTEFDPNVNSLDNLTVDTKEGKIRWKYLAQSAGKHSLSFMTNSNDNEVASFIEADGFLKTVITFKGSVGDYNFITPRITRSGDIATLTFGIPRALMWKDVVVKIYTKSLSNPVLTEILGISQEIEPMTDDRGYALTINASILSSYEIKFKVLNNSGETISLEAEYFTTVSLNVPKR